jgi:Arc/MetJ family transcription regulator
MMKRTNVVLDEEVVSKAKRITGIGTTRGVLDHALRELLRQHKWEAILKMGGKIHWEGDLRAMRRARRFR